MSEAAEQGQATDAERERLTAHGLSPDMADAIIAIDATMARLRRSIGRRELGRLAIEALDLPLEPGDLDLLFIAESGESELTVGMVAAMLDVDPSRASRIVADGVAKGLVRRVASQADARRICIEPTGTGRRYAAAVRAFKWRLMARELGQWPEEDLTRFAELFGRFSHWVADARTRLK